MIETLKAGAAQVEITPMDRQFLYGYPHVERYSTGVHDPLLSSSLYLRDGETELLFIANDIIYVGNNLVQRARGRICRTTGVPAHHIMITATHTHSGPITVDHISNEADSAVPKAEPHYLEFLENQIVKAAEEAVAHAQAAQIGLSLADSTGIGTNRRDPAGPADMQVPVLITRSIESYKTIACMLVCSMHPTVLHEDSTLISGDFPGLARDYLQQKILGRDCPVIHHSGPCGNQSPRHVTKANTFAEAERLGQVLGRAVEKVIPRTKFLSQVDLSCRQEFVPLPRKTFPPVHRAQDQLERAIQKLDRLRRENASPKEIRTAECDWFGAEETVTLAKAAEQGRLEAVYQSLLPAEIQLIRIGPWAYVGWPCEIFVEYSLAVKRQHSETFVISLANGQMQGYIVTEQAAREGGYEASNALFSHNSGQILVEKTLQMLNQ